MATLLLYLVVGFASFWGFLVAAFFITLNKMVTDEMRARLDDIPAVLVALALHLAPAHQREVLREDWVDNLLVAFDEKNARYPVTRLFLSVPFVLPLFGMATRLRTQARAVRRRAERDERLERLQANALRHEAINKLKLYLSDDEMNSLPIYTKPGIGGALRLNPAAAVGVGLADSEGLHLAKYDLSALSSEEVRRAQWRLIADGRVIANSHVQTGAIERSVILKRYVAKAIRGEGSERPGKDDR
jgi:hypothetical protein